MLFVIFILLSELLIRVSIHMFCIDRDVEVFRAKLFFSIILSVKKIIVQNALRIENVT